VLAGLRLATPDVFVPGCSKSKFYKISSYGQFSWTTVFLFLKGSLSRGTMFSVFLDATAVQASYKGFVVLYYPTQTIFKNFLK